MVGAPSGAASGVRLNEFLDGIRAEFESMHRQCENYEHQSKYQHAAMAESCRPEPTAAQETGSNSATSPDAGE